jgi:hypothetical protein
VSKPKRKPLPVLTPDEIDRGIAIVAGKKVQTFAPPEAEIAALLSAEVAAAGNARRLNAEEIGLLVPGATKPFFVDGEATPYEYLLACMRNTHFSPKFRASCAMQLMPYTHARVSEPAQPQDPASGDLTKMRAALNGLAIDQLMALEELGKRINQLASPGETSARNGQLQ